ncbi:nicotinate (nicotinamide) nucleotide adenylyltransferase [uncultured Pseudacidovorax sp.]|uniref:nicotinate (nicotinamide) nucleotide adenylyltransferase n=1 Tax=uncultured Pseudacidovorax sp. TaxID=679313 RepID=UPI0025CE6557|nr:nicotinate (nicotinamide) nucleotide adenylyltransferase [uncultured Pseudacidovorax sp.]
MALKPRVGVFGGAFDPPHNTHVALARAALAQLQLRELRVLPTGHAWHKARTLSDAADRVAMAQLAFEPLGAVVVDPRETLRSGPTYTLDTLRELRLEQPEVEWVLMLGTDQAAALPTWHGWQQILQIATVAVAERIDDAGEPIVFDPRSLPGLPAEARFESLRIAPEDTSATLIRQRAAQGLDLAALVPPAVARYIEQHHLYSPPDEH